MKVIIRLHNDSPDDGYHGYRILAVSIDDHCQKCGAPRGVPVLRSFMEDGAPYSVHCWDNPCGHIDSYVDVAKEAEKGGQQ